MAQNSDDIKNLFMNLGLNPGDYHEIRSAPTASSTVSEAPRRWSLLQSAPPLKNLTLPPVQKAPAATPPAVMTASPAPAPVLAVAPPAVAPPMASALPSALLAAAQDIARAELEAASRPMSPAPVTIAPPLPIPKLSPLPEPVITAAPAPAPSVLPSSLSAAFEQAAPVDGLQSLFQSVKEPQTAALKPAEFSRGGERRTDQLYQTPATSSPAQRLAALDAAASAAYVEPETRYAAPPPAPAPLPPPAASRLGPAPVPPPLLPPMQRPEPVPMPAPAVYQAPPLPVAPPVVHAPGPVAPPVVYAPAPVAPPVVYAPPSAPIAAPPAPAAPAGPLGRLKINVPKAEPRASEHGESLQDVFRRLSRDNLR